MVLFIIKKLLPFKWVSVEVLKTPSQKLGSERVNGCLRLTCFIVTKLIIDSVHFLTERITGGYSLTFALIGIGLK